MSKTVKKLLFYFSVFVFTGLLTWVWAILAGGRDAAILMYHSVGEPVAASENLNMDMFIFEKQMKFLHDRGYNVISLSDLADILKGRKRLPPKTVVLTFDDGYENNYTLVFPVLKKYNFPATIFVITDLAGREKEFYGHVYKFLDRRMIKDMSDSGLVSIGSHTLNHVLLTNIKDESALRAEIFRSKAILENMTKRPVELFSYPSGVYDRHIECLVHEAGYKAAVTTFPKKKGYAHRDICALKRTKATKSHGNMFIFFVQTSGYYLRMRETAS